MWLESAMQAIDTMASNVVDYEVKQVVAKYPFYHNSIYNQSFPSLKKNKYPNAITVKIVGIMISSKFQQAVHLAKVLHKHMPYHFAEPIIKGLTIVDWDEELRMMKTELAGRAYCIHGQEVIFINDNFLGGTEDFVQLVDEKYTYNSWMNYQQAAIEDFASFLNNSKNNFVYFHISINEQYVGTLIFELYTTKAPNTCKNFLRLCNQRKGGYGGTPIHRIVKDAWLQAGGFGIKDVDMPCENYIVRHDRRGVLCMANVARHCQNSTQFVVALQPQSWMNGRYVAFGQLISGSDTLAAIENCPTDGESPKDTIIIMGCGTYSIPGRAIVPTKNVAEYLGDFIDQIMAFAKKLYGEILEMAFEKATPRESILLEEVDFEEGAFGEEEINPKKENDEEVEILPRLSTLSSAVGQEEQSDPVEEDPSTFFYHPLVNRLDEDEIKSQFDLNGMYDGKYCLESDLHEHLNAWTHSEMKFFLESELFDGPTAWSDPESRRRRSGAPPAYVKKIKTVPMDADWTPALSESDLCGDVDEEDEDILSYIRENAETISYAGRTLKDLSRRAARNAAQGGQTPHGAEDLYAFESAMSSQNVVVSRLEISAIDVEEKTGSRKNQFLKYISQTFEVPRKSDESDLSDTRVQELETRAQRPRRTPVEGRLRAQAQAGPFDSGDKMADLKQRRAPRARLGFVDVNERDISHAKTFKRRATEFVGSGSPFARFQNDLDSDKDEAPRILTAKKPDLAGPAPRMFIKTASLKQQLSVDRVVDSAAEAWKPAEPRGHLMSIRAVEFAKKRLSMRTDEYMDRNTRVDDDSELSVRHHRRRHLQRLTGDPHWFENIGVIDDSLLKVQEIFNYDSEDNEDVVDTDQNWLLDN